MWYIVPLKEISRNVPTGFKPVKIVLMDQGGPAGPAFRIQVQASDVLAQPAT